ncbi:homocysteine S-methyltransferase family protein [Candidatus Peregrinibacteria bacterium]|nr:homocysteine S-methyltransferase family protein [Candidatus Peregrinibacteria bacterium]
MSRLLETGVKTLFGPYGSELQALGDRIGVKDLQNSTNITRGGIYREATLDLARRYLRYADVATTNTFGARALLRYGEPQLYREVVETQVRIILEALDGVDGKNLVVPLGPYGVDNRGCYNLAEAPSDSFEARDFHEQQLAVVRELRKQNPIDAVVFETISTGREALGAVLAAKKMGVPVIPSFWVDVEGNLKTGDKLADVLRHIDNTTGNYPLGYSVNCCPLAGAEAAIGHANGKRDRLIMAYPNASDADPSTLEEVDGAVTVRDHHTTAAQLVRMTMNNMSLRVVGGCCGFDSGAIATIAGATQNGFCHWREA